MAGEGWSLRVLSERDFTSQIGLVTKFVDVGFTKEVAGEGGGKITLDSDDGVLSEALALGEVTKVADQEALWQFVEDGSVRFEMLAEDVEEDVQPEGGGQRTTTITGRGTALVLEWAKVRPAVGTTKAARTFTGMHPMGVFRALFLEAQAAGYLDWVSLDFTEDFDSDDVAWGADQDTEVTVGTSLLDLLKRWDEEFELVWEMRPGFVLSVRKTTGRRLESTVVFTQFKGQVSHVRQKTRRELATDVYAVSGETGFTLRTDAAAVAKWHRRMVWVDAGEAITDAQRGTVAAWHLKQLKGQKVSRVVKVPAADLHRRVFVDYQEGDWVMIALPFGDSDAGAQRVLALVVEISNSGVVDVELTLEARFFHPLVKLKKAIEKVTKPGPSTGGGGGGAAEAVFSQKGAPTVGASGPYRMHQSGSISMVYVSLGAAGSSDTVVEVHRNLEAVATVTVPADQQTASVSSAATLSDGDLIDVAVITAGGGASDLTVQVTW